MTFGEVCKHQQLKRQCYTCELEDRHAAAEAVIKQAEKALGWISDPPLNMNVDDLRKTAQEAFATIQAYRSAK